MLYSKEIHFLLNLGILVVPWIIFGFDTSRNYMYVFFSILLVSINLLSRRFNADEKVNSLQKAVLITGCDTGFGNHLAKRLDWQGFSVFACCLFPDGAGANHLRKTCSNSLKVLPLDVTNDENVASALKFVKENLGSNVLWALVNNAGISRGFSFDFSTIQHFKDVLNVNALGPVKMTKAFLPLLKKSKGRIINVASITGRIAVKDVCSYTMSNHAFVAFSECLRLEMMPWGVNVILIEPEMFRTPMNEKELLLTHFEDVKKEIDTEILSSYGEKYIKQYKNYTSLFLSSSSENVWKVLDDLDSAVNDINPRPVYKPCRSFLSSLIRTIIENLPTVLFESIYSSFANSLGDPQLVSEIDNWFLI